MRADLLETIEEDSVDGFSNGRIMLSYYHDSQVNVLKYFQYRKKGLVLLCIAIRPYLEYCIQAQSFVIEKHELKLEQVQTTAVFFFLQYKNILKQRAV